MDFVTLDDLPALTNLDSDTLEFVVIYNEGEERTFGALKPQKWTINFKLEVVHIGGISLSVEEQTARLKKFAQAVPRPRLLYSWGNDTFGPCFLESCRLRGGEAGARGVLVLAGIPG